MKSLKWTSQNCCEPKFIEALTALMLFNLRRFQMSATVQRRDASCSSILWRWGWCAVCHVAQEGNKTQRSYERLQSSDGDGILKVRATPDSCQ